MTLSKGTLDFLDYHGYTLKINDSKVVLRKQYDYIGPLTLFIILLILSIPLYPISLALIILFFIGVYFHRRKSNTRLLIIYRDAGRISYSDFHSSRRFLFRHVKGLYLRSKFNGAYSSAFKRTNEEYQISLGIELIKGERYELFKLPSDYKEPSKEIIEIEEFLKLVLAKASTP